jgi:hypothetical protein
MAGGVQRTLHTDRDTALTQPATQHLLLASDVVEPLTLLFGCFVRSAMVPVPHCVWSVPHPAVRGPAPRV